MPKSHEQTSTVNLEDETAVYCPICQAKAHHEKCKVVCRSAVCVYRIIYNCSEF